LLRNVSNLLPDYTTPHRIGQYYSSVLSYCRCREGTKKEIPLGVLQYCTPFKEELSVVLGAGSAYITASMKGCAVGVRNPLHFISIFIAQEL
jgi:hypothetical protein